VCTGFRVEVFNERGLVTTGVVVNRGSAAGGEELDRGVARNAVSGSEVSVGLSVNLSYCYGRLGLEVASELFPDRGKRLAVYTDVRRGSR